MKTKIQAILNDIPQQETSYAKVVRELPENVKPNEKANAKLGKDASQYEVQLASQVRSACYVDRVSVLEITASQDGGHDDTDGDEQDDGASDDGMIDPGLADAAMDINGSEEDTEQIEEMVDDMEIDMSTDDEVTTP